MGSIALTVLTLTLGMFFIFVGQFKVTSKFFPDIHEDMVRDLTLHTEKLSIENYFLLELFREENSAESIKYFHFIKQPAGVHLRRTIEWQSVLLKLFVEQYSFLFQVYSINDYLVGIFIDFSRATQANSKCYFIRDHVGCCLHSLCIT